MPLFIVVEGIDGLGKSTLAKGLAEVLNADLVHTPNLLKGHLSNLATSLPEQDLYRIFMADRLLTYHTIIKPALSAGKHVVCDRYNLSNYAYQALQVGRERVLADAGYPPHLMLVCDGPVELALYRASLRASGSITGGLRKYEDPVRLRQTKSMYDEAIRKHASTFCDDLEIVDASKTEEEMLQQAVKTTLESLLQHNPDAYNEVRLINSRLETMLAGTSDST